MAKRLPRLIAVMIILGTLAGIFLWRDLTNRSVDPYSGILIVNTEYGQGSCFIVAYRSGWYYAITAGHVVEDSVLLTVDNEQYLTEIMRTDVEEDVALIRFQSAEDYKIYTFSTVEIGESCTTVGWSGENKVIYKGHIVSLDFDGYIAANGGVLPGLSGGALLDQYNRVIGVTVASPMYGGWVFESTVLYVPVRYAEAMVVTIEDK